MDAADGAAAGVGSLGSNCARKPPDLKRADATNAIVDVPSAVAVVGVDEIALAGLSRVSLTAVAQPREELARRAVALLLARIEGGIADERVQVMLEPRLVVRRSTAPFRLRRS